MMNTTLVATLFGLALGLAAAFGGTTEFLVVLVFGTAGVVVGRVLDGAIDLTPYVSGRGRDRSTR
jgi:hypothetical protein